MRARRIVFGSADASAWAQVRNEIGDPVSGRKLAQDHDIGIVPGDLGTLGGPRLLAPEWAAAPEHVPLQERHLAISGPVLADRACTDQEQPGPGTTDQAQSGQHEPRSRQRLTLLNQIKPNPRERCRQQGQIHAEAPSSSSDRDITWPTRPATMMAHSPKDATRAEIRTSRRGIDKTRIVSREGQAAFFAPAAGTSPGNSRKLSKLLRKLGTSSSKRFDSTVYLTS